MTITECLNMLQQVKMAIRAKKTHEKTQQQDRLELAYVNIMMAEDELQYLEKEGF